MTTARSDSEKHGLSVDPETPDARAIVLFDGHCPLCSRAVRFILPRDPRGHFHFAPLESSIGKELLASHGLPTSGIDTLVLIERDEVSLRSTAALRIARKLRFPWPLFAAFRLVPRFLRDAVYRAVARRRYQFFEGRLETCPVPPPRYRDRFLA